MNLTIYTYNNKGGKDHNEDYLDFYYHDNRGIFVLADGLGGHGNGEIASSMVAKTLLSALKDSAIMSLEELKESFYKANQALLTSQDELNIANMKTTAVVLGIYDDKAIWGHCGDSRLYYLSGNEILDITRDQSVTYKKYLLGEIPYKDINKDEDRSGLLGVFGNKDKWNPEFIDMPQVIKPGDAFLLCSDGFWEYIHKEEILIDFLKAETPKQWAELMLLRHIRRTKPSNDNYSLITVFVE